MCGAKGAQSRSVPNAQCSLARGLGEPPPPSLYRRGSRAASVVIGPTNAGTARVDCCAVERANSCEMSVVVVSVEQRPLLRRFQRLHSRCDLTSEAASCAADSSNFARSLASLICLQTNTRFFTLARASERDAAPRVTDAFRGSGKELARGREPADQTNQRRRKVRKSR